jgi:hypothetical protein
MSANSSVNRTLAPLRGAHAGYLDVIVVVFVTGLLIAALRYDRRSRFRDTESQADVRW